MTASVLGSRGAVGTGGRGTGLGGSVPVIGWRQGLAVTFCIDTRNGRSRSSAQDGVGKKLSKAYQWEYMQGRSSPGWVFGEKR